MMPLNIIWFFLSVGIFAFVTAWVTLAIIKFRRRPEDARKAKKVFGNLPIEILWTAIPLLIVISLFFLTVKTMIELDPPSGDQDPDIIVTGHQWWWEFQYPKSGVVTANEIHLPIHKKILLRVTSADVIHSFWVPALARKIDAIPGRKNYIYFEASKPGIYHGFCSEFCGTQHAGMRITAVAQTEEDFKTWERAQLKVPPEPTEGIAAQGAKLFAEKTCYNCHAIAGTGANNNVGPDLTFVATRLTLGAGVLKNSPENLAAWLHNPNTYKPGSHMPNFQLTPGEIKALVAYLEGLP
jgi:cytochrome c oxidase subunit 2